jgi:hypothetical protein
MRTHTWRALLGAALAASACTPFELPEKFTEPVTLPDGGVGDAGVFATDFTSCPQVPAPVPHTDGGAAPAIATLDVALQTSLGLVDMASSIPVGCSWPATATARLPDTAVASPQPVVTWSTGDAGVLSVDASGLVTGVAEGVTSLDVAAQTKTGTRLVWVGGEALLSITPGAGYQGFTESLHGTAAAGTVSANALSAVFSMRHGTGLDAVERAVVMEATSINPAEGQSIPVLMLYREFGEKLPGRVRDFTATAVVLVEQRSEHHARIAFTDVFLRGASGTASFSGHLEFSTP